MDKSELMHVMIKRSSLVLLLVILSGCALLIPDRPPPVVVSEPAPEPAPEPEVEAEPEVVPPPVIVREPEIVPELPPLPPPEQQPIAPLVAVVLSDRMPAYLSVADSLGNFLEEYEVYDLSDQSQTAKDAFAAIAASEAQAVVAIGLAAATAAQRFSTVPVVFSQVFNFSDYELLGTNMKGVAVLPPIELQIKAWRNLDPSIRNVGAILGAGHEAIIEETNTALQALGIKFHYAIAESDKETLYLFNRMIRDLDGYILFPDNRILSRVVLDEMMSYAARHRVQVAVFNEMLLDRGAIFSASAVPSDIAETIAKVLEAFIAGNSDSMPNLSPLTELKVTTNPVLVGKFGLATAQMAADSSVADGQ